MLSIGSVWDRTTQVLGGRAALLTQVAAAFIFLPTVIQAAIDAMRGEGAGASLIGAAVSIAAAILSIAGTLAMTAIASDPSVDGGRAMAIARDRIGPAIGIAAVALIVVMIAAIPGIALLAASGLDFDRAQRGLPQTAVNAGMIGWAVLWLAVFGLAMLWASARLLPLFAVVVNERLGLRAFARAFALTRRMTWKLIGVIVLFAIVLLVALAAASSVTGLIARLIAGGEAVGTIAFAAAVAGAIVTTAFTVIQTVFAARYYAAATERLEGAAPVA